MQAALLSRQGFHVSSFNSLFVSRCHARFGDLLQLRYSYARSRTTGISGEFSRFTVNSCRVYHDGVGAKSAANARAHPSVCCDWDWSAAMSPVDPRPVVQDASSLTAAQKRELVERVAGSDLFQRSP